MELKDRIGIQELVLNGPVQEWVTQLQSREPLQTDHTEATDVNESDEKTHHVIAQMQPKLSKPKIIVKVAVLGESQVGKTSLLARYVENTFDKEFIATLGLNVFEKPFELKNYMATIHIFELGGEQYTQLLPTAMWQAKAVLFIFDLTQKSSLKSIKRLYKSARRLNKVFKPILVGTKYDLFAERDLSFKHTMAEMARGCARAMHCPLIMCSAKTPTHVKQVFTLVVASVFQIRIKARQHSEEEKEPLLEYDIIYKQRRASVDHHRSHRHNRGSSAYRMKKKKLPVLMRSNSMAAADDLLFVSCLKHREFNNGGDNDGDNDDEKEVVDDVQIKENDEIMPAADAASTSLYKVNSRPKFDLSDADEEDNVLSVT